MKLRPFSSNGKRFLRAKHCEGEKRNTSHQAKFREILNIFLRRMKKQTFIYPVAFFMYVILPFFFAPLDAVCFVVVNKQHTHSLYSGPERHDGAVGYFLDVGMGSKTAARASTFSSAFGDGELYIRKNYTYHYKFPITCVCVCVQMYLSAH